MASATSARRIGVLWLVKGLAAGGTERLLLNAARLRDKERFDIHVACLVRQRGDLAADVQATGATLHSLSRSHRVHPLWLWRLRRLLTTRRYDVLHLHSPLAAAGARLVVRTLPRSRRPAVVSTEHCTWSSYRLPTRWANALLYRQDDLRFAVSQQVYESIWPFLRGDTQILIQGLLLEDLPLVDSTGRAEIRAELGLPGEAVVVATVAHYRSQKAYGDLLEAARLVVASTSDVHFLSMGHGPLETTVRRLRREKGLEKRFRLLGNRRDVLRILGACDLFVLASVEEGGPIAVMEALAMGLPVVATAVGFVPVVVRDGVDGIVVPPRRPDMLADGLRTLVSDPALRRRMSASARTRRTDFDGERVVRFVESKYIELAQRRSAVP